MSYKVEGTLGEVSMKLGAKQVMVKIIPSGDYARDISGQKKMLVVDDAKNKALLWDVNREFSIALDEWTKIADLLVAAKVSKLKVVLQCDEKASVDSLSVV